MNAVIFSLCLCCAGLQMTAQQYGYIQYNSDTDAPFNRVSTVLQDSMGYVWIGSENGLFRFDGIHFESFSLHTQSQFINQLHARDTALFFLNEMSLYQIKNPGARSTVSALIEGSIEENQDRPFYPTDFIIARDAKIWISQSNHSVARHNKDGYKTFPLSASTRPQKLAIQEDTQGGIWVLSPLDGLFRYNDARENFELKISVKNGQTLLIHSEYVVVGGDDLQIFKRVEGSLQRLKKIDMGGDPVTALHQDENDQFFIGTRGGHLYTLPDLESALQTIYGANEAHRVEVLNFDTIHEIFSITDPNSGNEKLWVASETGLWLLQQRFFKTVNNIPMNNPIGIAIGKEEKIWVPMNYLYEISPDGDDFTAQTPYGSLQTNAVAQDKDGNIWVSTVTPTVQLIQYENNKIVRRYDFHDRGEAIFFMYPDSKSNLWFCQAPVDKPIIGVARINAQGDVTFYDETKGFSSRVLAIKESSRGEIYAVGIGKRSYLYRYVPEQDRFENLSPPLPFEAILNFEAHDLTIDDEDIVWLATTDGLLRYDSENIILVQDDVLGQEEVRGVTHFSNNNLWIATATKGLVFHREDISTSLGEQEGLPASISAYRCIATDAEGRLWAGTAEGLVYSRISASTLPYSNAPVIRKISSPNEEIREDFKKVISIQKGDELQLEYSNLSFPSKHVEYQYRLLPEQEREIMLEEQLWQSNEKQNILSLIPEETGTYFLEIRARQPGGYQWSAPTEIKFKVYQPWYLQSWFIYGLIGLLVLFLGYYFRFYVKQRLAALQQILKSSNEKLASKEAQLNKKISEFEAQREELANANSNIQTLEKFINEIPQQASWDDVLSAMSKAVNHADDIDAFEIAYKVKNEIVHRGYSNQERSGFTFRTSPFDVKSSLTCWAMTNKKEVLINDFEKEHKMYIHGKKAYRFKSMLFIPFTLKNEQPVVLCAYNVKKNGFDPNDQTIFRILSQFIHFSMKQKLTKKV